MLEDLLGEALEKLLRQIYALESLVKRVCWFQFDRYSVEIMGWKKQSCILLKECHKQYDWWESFIGRCDKKHIMIMEKCFISLKCFWSQVGTSMSKQFFSFLNSSWYLILGQTIFFTKLNRMSKKSIRIRNWAPWIVTYRNLSVWFRVSYTVILILICPYRFVKAFILIGTSSLKSSLKACLRVYARFCLKSCE